MTGKIRFKKNFRSWFTVKRLNSAVMAFAEFQHPEEVLCYCIEGETEALVIDSGMGFADLQAAIRERTRKPLRVVNTHMHWDHIGGNHQFSRRDIPKPGSSLSLPPYLFEVHATPGHSPDSCVFFERKRGWLFSGDTLYFGPIVLSTPESDVSSYIRSLRFLRTLPIRRVFPGHNTFTCSPKLIENLLEAFRKYPKRKEGTLPACGRLRVWM